MTNKINSSIVNNGFAIPLSFNVVSNRLLVDVFIRSDVNVFPVFLFEYNGLYWFSFYHANGNRVINSRGFFSLRNCVSALKASVKALGFVFQDSKSLDVFVRSFEHSLKTEMEAL